MSALNAEKYERLWELWQEMMRLERVVDSHDHEPFDSCEVCGENGEYQVAKRKYENEAVYYVDGLMNQRYGELEREFGVA